VPRIGVDYGGLSWKKVRAIVEAVFGDLGGTLVVYEEFLRGNSDRAARPNDDLVNAAENFLPHILMFYKRFEDKRPVMLLDLQSQKFYAYPYKEFKDDLSERSQVRLAADYEKAISKNKVVVFVRDNETRRLVSMLFDNE
jgi:hypothetical protein